MEGGQQIKFGTRNLYTINKEVYSNSCFQKGGQETIKVYRLKTEITS
jgi:hypothetical protein